MVGTFCLWKADGSSDCRERTQKYLIHNYLGSRSLPLASKEIESRLNFLSALVGFNERQAGPRLSQMSTSRMISFLGHSEHFIALTAKQL